LAEAQLELIGAVAEHRDVHLWIPHPSPALWATLSGVRPAASRRSDPTVVDVRHPLLASLGRDSRELQLTLSGVPHRDQLHETGPRVDTLLGRLQSDIA